MVIIKQLPFYLMIYLVLTQNSWAKIDKFVCSSKSTDYECKQALQDAIFFNQNDILKEIIQIRGLGFVVNEKNPRGVSYIFDAVFFSKNDSLNIILSHPDYPAVIENKEVFLSELLHPFNKKKLSPKIVKQIFFPDDVSKKIDWFSNPEWPYPLLDEFKTKALNSRDKIYYKNLLDEFDIIDKLKSKICEFKSVSEIEDIKRRYSKFDTFLASRAPYLVDCAFKSQNFEIAAYALELGEHDTDMLHSYFLKAGKLQPNSFNLNFYKTLEKKLNDGKNLGSFWLLHHHGSQFNCLGDDEAFSTINDLSSNIAFHLILEELKKIKNTDSSRPEQIHIHVKNALEIFVKSQLPSHWQDLDGKTIWHHLAELGNKDIIEQFEKKINDPPGTSYMTVQDKEGNTPLHIAIISKNMSSINALADSFHYLPQGHGYRHQAELKMKNKDGFTPYEIIYKTEKEEPLKELRKEFKTIRKSLEEKNDHPHF